MESISPTERIVYTYTGETQRFPPTSPTEQLSQATVDIVEVYQVPDHRPWSIAVLTCIALALILFCTVIVVRVDSHAFAVLAAFGVAGFIYLAFGR